MRVVMLQLSMAAGGGMAVLAGGFLWEVAEVRLVGALVGLAGLLILGCAFLTT